MKIASTPPTAVGITETRARPPASANGPTLAKTNETVEISTLSAQLAHAENAPFDAARVAEIKQAIREGRFAISPERIADGLIDSVRELLRHKPAV